MVSEIEKRAPLIEEHLKELPSISVSVADLNKLLRRLVPPKSGTEYYDKLFDIVAIELSGRRLKAMTTNGHTIRSQSLIDIGDNDNSKFGVTPTLFVRGRQLSSFARAIGMNGVDNEIVSLLHDSNSMFLQSSSDIIVSVPHLDSPDWMARVQKFRRNLKFDNDLLEVDGGQLLKFVRRPKSTSIITLRQNSEKSTLVSSQDKDENEEIDIFSRGKISGNVSLYAGLLAGVLNRIQGTQIGIGIAQTTEDSPIRDIPFIKASETSDDYLCIMMPAVVNKKS